MTQMVSPIQRPPPKFPPLPPVPLPEDPAELANAFVVDAQGDLMKAWGHALDLWWIAAELGDDPWRQRSRAAVSVLLKRMETSRVWLKTAREGPAKTSQEGVLREGSGTAAVSPNGH
jgi:hypothetical protein